MTDTPAFLSGLLVHIQANLEGDLRVPAMARVAGIGPSQFHNVFRAAVGESPAHYVRRLRLDRAAFRLLIHESSVSAIAMDSGFDRLETFCRAFRRRFGRPPGEYRGWVRTQTRGAPRAASGFEPADFALSATRVVTLRACHLAFVRHLGPYESVPESLFDDLDRWANRRGLTGPRIWMGLGHDAPVATPPSRRRFDAALVVPDAFRPTGRIGYQRFPGGDHAVTTHVGPFSALPGAYQSIFPRVRALRGYRLVGLPAVEIYRDAIGRPEPRSAQTDIFLPVVRLGEAGPRG